MCPCFCFRQGKCSSHQLHGIQGCYKNELLHVWKVLGVIVLKYCLGTLCHSKDHNPVLKPSYVCNAVVLKSVSLITYEFSPPQEHRTKTEGKAVFWELAEKEHLKSCLRWTVDLRRDTSSTCKTWAKFLFRSGRPWLKHFRILWKVSCYVLWMFHFQILTYQIRELPHSHHLHSSHLTKT